MIKGWAKQGFTVVELLIVIVVIGILATIVFVGYSAVTSNANDRAVQADLNSLADKIDLMSLDNQGLPAGGASSGSTSGASTFPGVTFSPTKGSYATNVTNLYYCTGAISGAQEYALVARSKSGKVFAYRSQSGLSEYMYTMTTSFSGGPALCTSLGFSSPYRWSFGLNGSNGLWQGWIN